MAGIFSDLKVQYFILVLKKSKLFFVDPIHCVFSVQRGGVGPEGTDPGLTASWVAHKHAGGEGPIWKTLAQIHRSNLIRCLSVSLGKNQNISE